MAGAGSIDKGRGPAKVELLERLIGIFKPGWALEREAQRQALSAVSGYSGGRRGRGAYEGARNSETRADWLVSSGSADDDLLDDLQALRERSRDLNRNNGLASGISDTKVNNVIGTGIKSQCRVDFERAGLTEEQGRAYVREVEELWEIWTERADYDGICSFEELQQLVFRSMLENGEAFVLRVMDPQDRVVPLRWQVVEPDRVDTPPGYKPEGGGEIRAGVETDATGRRVAYHVRNTHPGDVLYNQKRDYDFQRIPAFDSQGRPNIVHLFKRRRAGQTRGVPFFAPVLNYFRDLADYMESEMVAARVAACFGVIIKSSSAGALARAAGKATEAGKRIQDITPGMVAYLEPDQDISTFNAARPGSNYEPFTMNVMRNIGSSLGLPYELLTKDFTKTTYTSGRMAILEARRYFVEDQQYLTRNFVQRSWNLVLETAFLTGALRVPGGNFYARERALTRAMHIAPGWRWVDPVKEAQASTMAIKEGLSTLAEEAAGQGRDWEEVLLQRKREQDFIRETGVQVGEPPVQLVQGSGGAGVDEVDDEDVDLEENAENAGGDAGAPGRRGNE